MGPGIDFSVIGGLSRGTCLSTYGISQDGGWVLIGAGGQAGWVSAAFVSIDGDAGQLPILSEAVDLSAFVGAGLIATITHTPTETGTASPTHTLTQTGTASPTQTSTQTRTPTSTLQRTATPRPTSTPRNTVTPFIPPTGGVMSCADTLPFEGGYVTCRIPRAYCSYEPADPGSPTFCNDAPYPDHSFTLLVWGADWTAFDGYCLLVSGYVSSFWGRPQIVATSTSQVAFCP